MACAISSLDDRSRERVEEARAKARPGLLTSIMHTHTASCVCVLLFRVEGRGWMDKAGLRSHVPCGT